MTEYHGPVLNSPADTRVRFCPSPTGTPHVVPNTHLTPPTLSSL